LGRKFWNLDAKYSMSKHCTAIILAAGKGTRMQSSLPKVLHPVCGRPMLHWIVEAVRPLCERIVVVLGHQRDQIQATLSSDVQVAIQDPPQGTGDAVRVATQHVDLDGIVLVLPGDAPLIRKSTLEALIAGHGEALCSVLTAHISPEEAQSSGYGRILRDPQGKTLAIVEAAGATAKQLSITEVNTGIYAFDARWLFEEILPSLKSHPPKEEYYLTDAIQHAAEAGGLQSIKHDNLVEVTGVNDRIALAELEKSARAEINRAWMAKGVHFVDPDCTYVDADVQLSPDVSIGPGVVLAGKTRIGEGAHIGAYSTLTNCTIAPHATIHSHSVCEEAVLDDHSSAGPFARLRQGTHLGPNSKVGNFVEIKKTKLGKGAKASHLSYLGDTTVGAGANIGAGTITCNYDGHAKHPTVIGKDAFIGSNSALIAPITIGEGAIVAAGSTLTQDVPGQALALARAGQSNIEDAATRIHIKNAEKAAQDSE
jgi:bifunctional UDP-N-acetylglucosamine pyrophosphorylase/glucosamine-1-phosphate N-acetyltransferase